MTRETMSLLLGLVALTTVVTSNPVSVNLQHSHFQPKDMIAAMVQIADKFLSQNNVIEDFQQSEGNFEMHISGFTGVIKTKGNKKVELSKEGGTPEDHKEEADPKRPGYVKLGEGSYKFYSRGADWATAKTTCQSEGAHLLAINSEEEAQLVVDLFARHPSPDADHKDQIWVGVNDLEEEGKFNTVLGEALSTAGYASWNEDQPNDWRVMDPNGEDCVTMKWNKQLNDLACTDNVAFVCEAGDTQPMATAESDAAAGEEAQSSQEQSLSYEEEADPTRPGYVKLGEGSYKFHSRGADWPTANATCESESAHLLVVNSEEEAQLVVDLFARHPSRDVDYNDQIWVGVNDLEEEGKFVTVLGGDLSAAGYASWFDGQPDDWRVVDPSGEDCVTMKRNKMLNDVHCTAKMPYVCEAGDMELTSTTESSYY